MFSTQNIFVTFFYLILTSISFGQDYHFSADEFEDDLYEKEIIKMVVTGFGLKNPDPSAEETLEYLEIQLSEILDGIEPLKTDKRIKGINKIGQEGSCCLRFTYMGNDSTHGFELDFSKIVCSTIEIVRKNHPQTFAYGYSLKMATKDGLQYVAELDNEAWLMGKRYNASSLEFYDWTGKSSISVKEMEKLKRAFKHACKKCDGFDYDEPDFPDN